MVLSDIMMPRLNGFELFVELRARSPARFVPLVLVTAAADREQRLRGIEVGAHEFLEKPIDRAILIARIRTLLALQDATDALRERNGALEELQMQQRELTAFLVHDLKNPIAIVTGNVEWARDQLRDRFEGPGYDDVKDALSDAQDASRRMLAMVGDMLAISRLEQAELRPKCEVTALEPLLRAAARARARDAARQHVSITVECAGSVNVNADPALLQRVIENLVDNALRHAPEGGRVELEARSGQGVVVSVSNTGLPIPVGARTRIFEKFGRGDASTTSHVNVGLGLYFCKLVVDVHGGAITTEESERWPTSFVIRMP